MGGQEGQKFECHDKHIDIQTSAHGEPITRFHQIAAHPARQLRRHTLKCL